MSNTITTVGTYSVIRFTRYWRLLLFPISNDFTAHAQAKQQSFTWLQNVRAAAKSLGPVSRNPRNP